MIYPNLNTNIHKVLKNTKEIVKRTKEHGIDVTAVTKCTGGNSLVAEAFAAGGARAIGDSRLKNLAELDMIELEKWLIRIPMISETEATVLYSDLSLNSELSVLSHLNQWAKHHHKRHKVILMIDHGDLREGWFDLDEFYRDLKVIRDFDWLDVRGIGTNSNCAGAVIPEPTTFENFPHILEEVVETLRVENPIVSGGNSGAYYMVEDGTIPSVINNLRLGELLLFGHETSYQKEYPYLSQDIFTLSGEIIELKEKCETLSSKVSLVDL